MRWVIGDKVIMAGDRYVKDEFLGGRKTWPCIWFVAKSLVG